MIYKTIDPPTAHELMSSTGATYLDVRTAEEFAAGHPEGAVNVPVFVRVDGRMAPNPDFLPDVQARFASDATLLVGCQMGGRSAQACTVLGQSGYTDLSNVHGGFGGHPGGGGLEPQAGWRDSDLPCGQGSGT